MRNKKWEKQTKASENQALSMFCFPQMPEPFINTTKLSCQFYDQLNIFNVHLTIHWSTGRQESVKIVYQVTFKIVE